MSRLLEIVLGNAGSAALLAIAVAIAGRWIRQPTVRHILWVVVLLRLLAPPIVELGLLPAPPAPTAAAVVATPLPTAPATVAPLPQRLRVPLKDAAATLWLTGLLLVGAVMVVRTTRLRRSVAVTTQHDTVGIRQQLARLCEQLGISRPPAIQLVAGGAPPILWGRLGAPCIVLPTPLLESLTETETEALIAHELAHLKRRDHWVRRLEMVVSLLFWWHPVVWWARRRIHVAEELCCDAMVTTRLPKHARAYATCLVKTARYLSTNRPAAVGATAMASLPELKGRITMIMNRSSSQRLGFAARATLLASTAALLLISPTLSARAGDAQLFAGQPITLSLHDAQLGKVLSTFAQVADATIAISPQATASGVLESLVTVDVEAQPWDAAFDNLLSARDLAWRHEGDVIWIYGIWESLDGDRDFTGKPIALQLDGADLHDVLRMMSTLTGFEIEADADLDVAVTIDVKDLPWDQVLDMILRVNGLTYAVDGSTIRVTTLTNSTGVLMTPVRETPLEADPPVSEAGEMKVYRYTVNGPISAPVKVEAPPPEYPQEARDARIQGAVVLQVVIDSTGSIAEVKVIRGLPLGVTESAVEAVRRWQFEPAHLDGEPVAVQYVLTVRFELDDAAPPN